MRKVIFVVASVLLLIGVFSAVGCSSLEKLTPPELPPYEKSEKNLWLNQNWTNKARYWYHHTPQGTQTVPIPVAWFLALEQPKLFPKGALLHDEEYLARFGFIPSHPGEEYEADDEARAEGFSDQRQGKWKADFDQGFFLGNPYDLPVGFALTKEQKDPFTGEPRRPMLGFTCATCHTGQLTYGNTNIRIDGGPAQINLGAFTKALGVSLAYTKIIPGRFGRFADRVLGPDATSGEKRALKKSFDTFLTEAEAASAPLAHTAVEGVPEGFARLDALNRIGTQLFFSDLFGHEKLGMDPKVNVTRNNAPVNYPHIWSTGWFDWVQYDASIMQPMIRNAGEALGVRALLNIAQSKRLFDSTVLVDELYDMETLLSGSQPTREDPGFKGLKAPEWPVDVLGAIDRAEAKRGELLYEQHCASCHGPSVHSDTFWSDRYWQPIPDAEGKYLQVGVSPVEVVGTDPQQSKILRERKVVLPDSLKVPAPKIEEDGRICGPIKDSDPQRETLFAWALAYVTQQAVDNRYDLEGKTPEEREETNGRRPNCVRANSVYKARPLNGIWATAPFLHNGSVLDLYQLLGPASERAKSICLGDREFDPVKVGLVGRCLKGTTRVDTTKLGNLASGHSFESGYTGKAENGIVGPALSEDDRMALIEYLKTQ